MKRFSFCIIFVLISILTQAKTTGETSQLLQLTKQTLSACEANDTILVKELLNEAISDYKSYSGEELEELQIAQGLIMVYLWNNKKTFKDEWLHASLNKDTTILSDLYQLKQELEQDGLKGSILHLATIIKICDIYRNTNQDLSVISLIQKLDINFELIKNSMMLRTLYLDLGTSYYKIGDYNLSKISFFYSKILCEAASDFDSTIYAVSLLLISKAYDRTHEPLMAKLYTEQAINVYQSHDVDIWECKDVLSIDILNTYGQICESLEDYETAENVYSQIQCSPILDSIKQDVSSSALMNAAALCFYKGDYAGAIDRMKKIDCRKLSPLLQIGFMSNLFFYEYLSRNQDFYNHLMQYNDLAKDYLLSLYTQLSRKERERIWNEFSKEMNFYNYMVLQKDNTETIINAYNNALFSKNMLLHSSQIEDAICNNNKNPYLKELLDRKAMIKRQLKDEGSMTFDRFIDLSSNLISVEKEIYRNTPNFKKQIANSFNSWENVRSSLKEGELAIEFIEVNGFHIKDQIVTDSICVLLLTYNSTYPEYIKLCSSGQLSKFLNDAVKEKRINQIYSTSEEGANELYKMIWQPLSPKLAKYKTIYYSPVSTLNRLNLSAIPYSKTQTMGEHWNMIMVSCTDNIHRDTPINLNSCAVFGGVNYDGTEDELRSNALAYRPSRSSDHIFRGEDRGRYWGNLTGTKEEADSICNLLKKNDVSCKLYEGLEANEEAVKALDGESPSILHFATHGFYITKNEEKEQMQFLNRTYSGTAEDNSMKCSGLILAGGNISWMRGKGFEGIEDGILTAEEIMQLDLHTTDLVVLSACETALGDHNSVDGVFGLQRAFKKAGVNTIIMTLWSVNDNVTKELMLEFYENLLESKSKRSAFNAAVQTIRAKYKLPTYWAGFVMLD